MPAALTIEQKRERNLQKMAEKAEGQVRTQGNRTGSDRKRGMFNGTQGKLTVNREIAGYHLHILNDTPGRIQNAVDAGYEFVTPEEIGGTISGTLEQNSDLGEKVRYRVGADEAGNAMYAYLMKIRQDWYEEDQQIIQSRIDQVDDAIKNGKLTGDGNSTEGFYVPKGGIKVS
jgi:hypothetical protein